MLQRGVIIASVLAFAPSAVFAAPAPSSTPEAGKLFPSSEDTLAARAENDAASNPSSNLSPQVWVPITVVAVILFCVVVVSVIRKGWGGKILQWTTNGAAHVTGTTIISSGAREITADQLAGVSQSGNGNSTNGTTTQGNTRTRRSRRNRRNSATSTRSLPVYMKEPGDQELVIIRGADDMEDMPTDGPHIEVALERSESTLQGDDDLSRATTRSPSYDPVPTSPQSQPLLQPDDQPQTQGPQQGSLGRSRNISIRPSYETLPTSEESDTNSAALVQAHPVPPALQDVRGEAPPYFEVVSVDDLNVSASSGDQHDELVASPTNVQSPQATSSSPEPSSPPSQGPASRIRTSILNLFNSKSNASVPPVPSLPVNTSQGSASRIGGHSRTESGPSVMSLASTSEGGSRLSHVRTRSRPNTPGHRPSHSGTNSVFSISSSAFRPLSRTRTRSQHHLNTLDNANNASTISVNSISPPLTHTVVKTALQYPKSGPTPEQLKLISSRESFARFGVPYGPDAVAYAAASQSRVDLSSGPPPPDFEDVVRGDAVEEGESGAGPSGSAMGQGQEGEGANEDAASVHEVSSPEQPEPSSTAQAPASQAPASSSSSSAPAPRPSTSTSTSLQAQQTLSPSNVPPSAFKDPSAPFPRSESRASSYLSFATAEESLHSSGDSVFVSSPLSTPLPSDATPSSSSNPAATPLSSSSKPSATPVPSTHATPQVVIDTSHSHPVSNSIQDKEKEGEEQDQTSEAPTPSTTAPPTPRMTSRHVHEDTDMTVTPSSTSTHMPASPTLTTSSEIGHAI
ncbi:hypothetical protein K474DRAFT_1709421 [Panus rudis PR-1116 ss-1]|nr:hypothetical protein K474DRAFT_1709421 [Panus rudis PR-1116 ss-1]